MAVTDLPRYRGNDSYCPKCGTRGARSQWVSATGLHDLCASPPVGFAPIPGMETGEHDLIERECECGYSWWELPLDSPLLPEAPDLGDSLEEENQALRRLIVSLAEDLALDPDNTPDLTAPTVKGLALVLRSEEDDQADRIEKAAPFFGPLRTEWEV